MIRFFLISFFVLFVISLSADERWVKIEDGGKGKSGREGFVFRIPPELIDQKVHGIDSSVGQYKCRTQL